MRFFNVLAIASAALAIPTINERQTTPLGVISSSVNILQASSSVSEGAIDTAVVNAQNNVDAAASVAASVNANLKAIADGFVSAAASITAALTQAGFGVGGQLEALAQAELDNLAADLVILANIIASISATVTVEVTNLVPAAQAAISSEINVVESAIAPVVNPIMVFADAVSKVSAKAGATVTGVANAYAGVQAVVEKFAATNGLPGIAFPGYAGN